MDPLEALYAFFGISGAIIFTVLLALGAAGGGHHDATSDVHHDVGTHNSSPASSMVFGFLTIRNLLAFLTGFGLLALAGRFEWALPHPLAALVGVGGGMAMAVIAALVTAALARLARAPEAPSPQSLVGRQAKVYVAIPECGAGSGEVEVVFEGRLQILPATSTGGAISSFTDVSIVGVREDGTLIVDAFLGRLDSKVNAQLSEHPERN